MAGTPLLPRDEESWLKKTPPYFPLSIFFYNSAHNSGTKSATAPRKAHSIALLTLFGQHFVRSGLRSMVNGLASREQKTLKITFFLRNRFYVITFDSVTTCHSLCQHRISRLKTRRMSYHWALKVHFENLTSCQGHDMIGKGHVAYQFIRMVDLNTSMVFSLL